MELCNLAECEQSTGKIIVIEQVSVQNTGDYTFHLFSDDREDTGLVIGLFSRPI